MKEGLGCTGAEHHTWGGLHSALADTASGITAAATPSEVGHPPWPVGVVEAWPGQGEEVRGGGGWVAAVLGSTIFDIIVVSVFARIYV